ncbi:hypothetical protein Asp14428_35220 [Actinoplanes sp. NBRC 14428]|nr:hypothetical protein Asp14428_35220 [Actinoplanes sp. NBRC 14428]
MKAAAAAPPADSTGAIAVPCGAAALTPSRTAASSAGTTIGRGPSDAARGRGGARSRSITGTAFVTRSACAAKGRYGYAHSLR